MKYLLIEYPKCSTCRKAKKFLDDHGISYEDRHIVERNPTADELELLATNGMLVRRPLLIGGDRVFVGFRETEWAALLK